MLSLLISSFDEPQKLSSQFCEEFCIFSQVASFFGWCLLSSRMMIPAYQNDLQMFPIFRMQFALLDGLCIPAIISCEKLDLRVNISGCASYGAVSRILSFRTFRMNHSNIELSLLTKTLWHNVDAFEILSQNQRDLLFSVLQIQRQVTQCKQIK